MIAKSYLPQGTLLIANAVATGLIHGCAIARRLQQGSRDVVQVPQGSVYPALQETETGRDAKFYRLTPKGRAQLEMKAASWRRLAEAAGLILKMSEGGAQ